MSIEKEIRSESLRFVKNNRNVIIDPKMQAYVSPRITSEYMDCSMPMTFDSYSHCSLGCSYCLPSGSKILMATGREKVIERIEEGELVITYNEKENRFESSEVTAMMRREESELIEIKTKNKTIMLTKEHPIFVKNKGWIEVGYIKENDKVIIW